LPWLAGLHATAWAMGRLVSASACKRFPSELPTVQCGLFYSVIEDPLGGGCPWFWGCSRDVAIPLPRRRAAPEHQGCASTCTAGLVVALEWLLAYDPRSGLIGEKRAGIVEITEELGERKKKENICRAQPAHNEKCLPSYTRTAAV